MEPLKWEGGNGQVGKSADEVGTATDGGMSIEAGGTAAASGSVDSKEQSYRIWKMLKRGKFGCIIFLCDGGKLCTSELLCWPFY